MENEIEVDSFVTVPVMLGFDKERIIGSLRIKKDELPKTTDYVFTIGYRATSATEGELFGVSLLSDKEYLNYLKWEEDGKPA